MPFVPRGDGAPSPNPAQARTEILPRHLTLKERAERFSQLRTIKKHSVDTIKRIAYRAETALVAPARETLSRSADARSLIRQLFESAADLYPNLKALAVRVHRLSSPIHDGVMDHLCTELTSTETTYPGTICAWF